MKRLIILSSISVLLLVACNKETVRKDGFSVHGIDVSHYQKNIDWKAVAAQNIHFAFIKATEGEDFRDTLFCKNWEALKATGLKRGAYHFFRPTVSAESQALNFISCIDLQTGDLAPVLDVEVTDGASEIELLDGVATWLQLVEEAFCVKPIIYTNQKFYNKHLNFHFPEHPIWIARYHDTKFPDLEADQPWQFWQYGNRGRMNGINGDVDFNVFRGSLDDLEQLCYVAPAAPTSEETLPEVVASANP